MQILDFYKKSMWKKNYHNLGLISYRLLSHEMNCLSELCHDL